MATVPTPYALIGPKLDFGPCDLSLLCLTVEALARISCNQVS